MKLTIIFAGVLATSSLAVAQDPIVTLPPEKNPAHQPGTPAPAPTDTPPPQQSAATNQTTGASVTVTNQTNGASVTNAPSSATTSNNVSNTSTNTNNTSTTSHPVTILRGSDPTTTSRGQIPPQNDSGLDPVRSTAGTPDDWRSGSSGLTLSRHETRGQLPKRVTAFTAKSPRPKAPASWPFFVWLATARSCICILARQFRAQEKHGGCTCRLAWRIVRHCAYEDATCRSAASDCDEPHRMPDRNS